MTLMRALAMPFQLQSLLLIGISAVLLTVVNSVGGPIAPLAILAAYILSIWLNRFAFAMLDAAANGERETPVASVEMLSAFTDPRSWVHPLLGAAVVITLLLQPQWPRLPVYAAAALLFPLSLGATAFTDRLVDAVNPLAWWRTLRGLAHGYLLLVTALVLCVVAVWFTWQMPMWKLLQFFVTALLFFCYYALVGGVLFWRRNALDFSPRQSPERVAEKQEAERAQALQRVIDEVYVAVRARKLQQAMLLLASWIDNLPPARQAADVNALLAAGPSWNEPRGFLALMSALIGKFCADKRLSLALGVAEQAMKQSPQFAPAPGDSLALIRHAAHNGRRKLAGQLLDNATRQAGEATPALEGLRAELQR